jgi:hypothetical protein
MRRLNLRVVKRRMAKLEGVTKTPIQRIMVAFGEGTQAESLSFVICASSMSTTTDKSQLEGSFYEQIPMVIDTKN